MYKDLFNSNIEQNDNLKLFFIVKNKDSTETIVNSYSLLFQPIDVIYKGNGIKNDFYNNLEVINQKNNDFHLNEINEYCQKDDYKDVLYGYENIQTHAIALYFKKEYKDFKNIEEFFISLNNNEVKTLKKLSKILKYLPVEVAVIKNNNYNSLLNYLKIDKKFKQMKEEANDLIYQNYSKKENKFSYGFLNLYSEHLYNSTKPSYYTMKKEYALFEPAYILGFLKKNGFYLSPLSYMDNDDQYNDIKIREYVINENKKRQQIENNLLPSKTERYKIFKWSHLKKELIANTDTCICIEEIEKIEKILHSLKNEKEIVYIHKKEFILNAEFKNEDIIVNNLRHTLGLEGQNFGVHIDYYLKVVK